MKKVFNCRRSFLAVLSLISLTWIALENGTDVSIAITGIIAAVASANAYEKTHNKKDEQ